MPGTLLTQCQQQSAGGGRVLATTVVLLATFVTSVGASFDVKISWEPKNDVCKNQHDVLGLLNTIYEYQGKLSNGKAFYAHNDDEHRSNANWSQIIRKYTAAQKRRLVNNV
eukprot:gene27629-23196_t